MALNFSTENCTDRTYIDDAAPDGTEVWHPAVQVMAFGTMSLGINKITEDNWETFYERYTQNSVATGYTADWWYLTPPMVKSFIGFKTNASTITDHKWKLHLAETVMATTARFEEQRPRPFLVRFTGERITEESAAEGMPAESGWVDLKWSRRKLHDDPKYVPAAKFDTLAECQEHIESFLGATEPTEGDTYYAVDSEQDPETGDYWKYAAHIETVKAEEVAK